MAFENVNSIFVLTGDGDNEIAIAHPDVIVLYDFLGLFIAIWSLKRCMRGRNVASVGLHHVCAR